MKSIQNFAAQQLTKKQMIAIKGGAVNIMCPLYVNGILVNYIYASGDTLAEAGTKINEKVPSGAKTGKCEIS